MNSSDSPFPKTFINFIFELHYALLLGESPGYVIVSSISALLIISVLTGLIVWWPLTGRWLQALIIKRKASTERFMFDLHKTVGFYSALVLLPVLFSGIYMDIPEHVVPVVELFSPVTYRYWFHSTAIPDATPITMAQAVAIANKTTWTIDDKSSLDIGFSFENQQLYHPIVDKVMLDFGGGPLDRFSLLVDSNQQDWGTSARYNLRLDSHELLLGLNFGTNSDKGGNYTNNGGNRGPMTNQITKKADNIEIFAQDHWHITDKWTLTPALQGVFAHREVNNIRLAIPQDAYFNFYPQGGNPSNDYSGINPSLGLMYNLTKSSSLYGNVSRLYAPPTNYNISDNITAGAGTAKLKATEGTSIEIGSRGMQNIGGLNSVNWDLALYYSWLNNEILSTGSNGTYVSRNFDNTIHAGVEGLIGGTFALDSTGTHTIKPMLSYTVNRFSFDNDRTYGNNALPAAPDYFLKGEAMYQHASGYFMGPTFDVAGQRWGDYANTYKIASYGLLGMRAVSMGSDLYQWGQTRLI